MDFIDVVTSWPLPATLVSILLGGFLICQLIGEIIELFGKTSPIFFKVRKAISNKIEDIKNKKASRDLLLSNMQNTLNQVNEKMPQLEAKYTEAIEVIKEFNKHYDAESINKRDKWMLTVNSDLKWAHDRAKTYDASVGELKELATIVKDQQNALELNNKMTSELYKQATRTQILDFSHKLVNARKAEKPVIFSREEFRKIRKSYNAYEKFLINYGGTNGEVDDAMVIIKKAERGELPNIEFLEDLRD